MCAMVSQDKMKNALRIIYFKERNQPTEPLF